MPRVAAVINRMPPADRRIVTLRASALTGNLTVEMRGVISAGALKTVLDPQLAAAAKLAADQSAGIQNQPAVPSGHQPVTLPLRGSTAWHSLPAGDVLNRLVSDLDFGLAEVLAAERIKTTGLNDYDLSWKIDRMLLLRAQLFSVPNAVLTGSALLSLLAGGLIDALFVGAVIAFNAAVGFRTSLAAETSIKSLGAHVLEPVRVLRAGKWSTRDPSNLVPGDIIRLQQGTVPADCLLLAASGMSVDESSLTGESASVSKFPGVMAAETPLADRSNMLHAGTVVTGGSGTAVVIATGLRTELGRVKHLTARDKMRPPLLQKQLDELGRTSVRHTAIACGVYLVAGVARGIPIAEMLKSSASLAVAAIPEGLTAVGTVSFAKGIERMRLRGIYSRDLRAIETIGCTHYLCLDKTGTITINEMVADQFYCDSVFVPSCQMNEPARRSLLEPAARVAVLCNDAVKVRRNGRPDRYEGSSTEIALLKFAENILPDPEETRHRYHRTDAVYRSNLQRYMVTRFCDGGATTFEAMKGDPLPVIRLCERRHTPVGPVAMTEADRSAILAANAELSRDGYRVLAMAFRDNEMNDSADLTFAGLIALKNPVRQGVAGMIAGLRQAGIQPVLITGDQIETAVAIARELGFNGTYALRAMDATFLRDLNEAEREREVRRTQVFARVSPAEKLEIVRLLQKDGSVVTMIGDGINDSPALRAADVGVAMGRSGASAARDTADLVISDDDLGHLLHAITEGRTIRRNLEQVTRFLLTTNYCETIITITATLIAGRCTLTPLQLLWINTITDVFPALAMVSRPPDQSLLTAEAVKPDAPFFTEDHLKDIMRDAVLMSVPPAGLLMRSQSGKGVSTGLTALITGQMAYATGVESFVGDSGRTPIDFLSVTALASVALQAVLPHTPVGRVLGLDRLSAGRLLTAGILGSVPALICHGDFFRQRKVETIPNIANGGLRHV
jgi:Ca2+-transporting ATPase